MTPDDERHGTNAGAVQHWRDGDPCCHPCAKAARRMRKGAAVDAARGLQRTVQLGQHAIDVIHAVPLDQLSRRTGIKVAKLCTYRVAGPDKMVRRTTRDTILTAGAAAFWTPAGIRRRLQALTALGWSMNQVSVVAGIDMDTLKKLRSGKHGKCFVTSRTATAVVEAYESLSMTLPAPGRGPSKTRTYARTNGWSPPLAWDSIDDPNEQPATVWKPTRNRKPADLFAELDHLLGLGVSEFHAAKQLGITQDAIEKARARAGRVA